MAVDPTRIPPATDRTSPLLEDNDKGVANTHDTGDITPTSTDTTEKTRPIGDSEYVGDAPPSLFEPDDLGPLYEVSEQQYALIFSLSNPDTGLSPIQIFQRAYMDFNPEFDPDAGNKPVALDHDERDLGVTNHYGIVSDGFVGPETAEALEDCLDDIQRDGGFAISPRWEHILPQSLRDNMTEKGVVEMETTPSLPYSGLSTNLFASQARKSRPEDPPEQESGNRPAQTSKTTGNTPPEQTTQKKAESPHKTAKTTVSEPVDPTKFKPTQQQALDIVKNFVFSDFSNPGNISRALQVLTLEANPAIKEKFNKFEKAFLQYSAFEKTPPHLVTAYDRFIEENYDLLYPASEFGSSFCDVSYTHQTYEWMSQLVSSVYHQRRVPEEYYPLIRELVTLVETTEVTESSLEGLGIEPSETYTPYQQYLMYFETLWMDIVGRYQQELDQIPRETQLASVRERFGAQHMFGKWQDLRTKAEAAMDANK
ncbi:MAG: hypothetical protein ACD_62C00091G0003 [uncultured bacterium]|nr:MAG: hypothetical protein ACD_62C00091G0003 [uncultured bacterium]HLD44064.1 hypothetical protein [bacterium]